MPGELLPRSHDALAQARAALLELQRPDGSWKSEFQTNPYVDALDLIFRRYVAIDDHEHFARTAAWIRACQQADGGWAPYHGSPSRLTNTVAAYVGLRLAGADPSSGELRSARAFVLDHGGLSDIEPWLAVHLAFVGLWPWSAVPPIPPEVLLVPSGAPLSLDDLAWWATVMLVPLSICTTMRPVRPCGFDIEELVSGPGPVRYLAALSRPVRGLVGLARAYLLYTRIPGNVLHRRALAMAEQSILSEQDPNGLFGGGLLFATHFSVIALLCLGYPLDHPVVRRALGGLDSLVVHDGTYRRVEFCDSSVCDTAVVMRAVCEAGGGQADADVAKATSFLLDHQTPSGGWGFEDGNRRHPDADNTMVIATSLRTVQGPGNPLTGDIDEAIERASAWTMTVQHSSGGWSTFEAKPPRRLPFRAMLERRQLVELPATDVTGHVVEWLALDGHRSDPSVAAALDWLCAAQTDDGSWPSVWAANHVFGTYAGLKALLAMGGVDDVRVTRAVRWLIERQNPDGGWGEDLRSYDDPGRAGRGESTVQHTAIALGGLLDVLAPTDGAIVAGVEFLLAARDPLDGLWREPHHVYPLIRAYDLWYRIPLWTASFPVLALAAYVRAIERQGTADALHGRAT